MRFIGGSELLLFWIANDLTAFRRKRIFLILIPTALNADSTAWDSLLSGNMIRSPVGKGGCAMAGLAITRLDLSSEALRRRAVRVRDPNVARRLLALALVLEGHSRADAARSCGMDRQTLRDWVHRYNAEGVAGLSDRKAPGAKPKLSAAQEAEVASWVRAGPELAEDGVVRWRRCDLARKIERRFGVVLAERSVGGLLRRLGFRRLSVRPQHPQQDAEALEAHKKTLPLWSPAPSPTRPKASRSNSGGRTKPGSASKAP